MERKMVILLVDDDDDILRSSKRAITDFLEAEVYTASNGIDGLALLGELAQKGTSIDLIVSDYEMPGILGLTFLDKAHELMPNAARVLASGNPDARGKAQEKGIPFFYKGDEPIVGFIESFIKQGE